MIRLSRVGKIKEPSFRLVISEKTKDPWGDSLEILGFYNHRTTPVTLHVKGERIAYWISKGAQLSDTVHNLFVDQGIVKGPKRKITHRKAKKEEASAPKPDTKPEAKPEAKKEEPKVEEKK